MSEITPPSPPSQPPPSSAPPPTAAVSNPPAALIKELSLGAKLDAVIAGTTPKGLVEIETSFGRLALQTNFPLPPNGPLQLQLTAKGPQLLFLITAIHGLQPKAALRSLGLLATPSPNAGAQAGRGGVTPSPAGLQGGAPSPTAPLITATGIPGGPIGGPIGGPALGNLAVGATLTATLLRAGPAGPAAPGGSASTGGLTGTTSQAGQGGPGPGSPATGTSHARPGQAGISTPSSPSSSLATPGATSGARAGGAPPVPAASSFPPGTLFSIRITAFQPAPSGPSRGASTGASPGAAGGTPPLSPPAGGSLAPGGTISGIVIGRASPSGHLIVQTHGGSVSVATQTPAPAGSTVTFEVLSQSPPTAGTGVHPGVHVSPMAQLLAGRWPGLEEALTTLEELNPAAAQQLLQAVLPRPGLTLGANMLFFLAALTGGNLRGWIGDGPARILLKNRPDLFGRLRDDFGRLRAIADEPRAGDWRATLLPFLNGADIEQIRLFMRNAGEQPEDDGEEGRKGTRFIVELNLTRIGRFQLDGLVYEKEKHLDLIVRTKTELPQKMRDDIRDIFANANSVTGLKGGIVFQAAPPNFIEIEGLDPEPENLGLIV